MNDSFLVLSPRKSVYCCAAAAAFQCFHTHNYFWQGKEIEMQEWDLVLFKNKNKIEFSLGRVIALVSDVLFV